MHPDDLMPSGNSAQPGKKILVVDDNPDMRRLIRITLGSAYEVLEAGDGERALAQLSKHMPDLVVLDIMMPGTLDGIQVLERIKSSPEWQHILVMMLTARGQASDYQFGMSKGADAYFVKPFSPMQLLQWVRARLV